MEATVHVDRGRSELTSLGERGDAVKCEMVP